MQVNSTRLRGTFLSLLLSPFLVSACQGEQSGPTSGWIEFDDRDSGILITPIEAEFGSNISVTSSSGSVGLGFELRSTNGDTWVLIGSIDSRDEPVVATNGASATIPAVEASADQEIRLVLPEVLAEGSYSLCPMSEGRDRCVRATARIVPEQEG